MLEGNAGDRDFRFQVSPDENIPDEVPSLDGALPPALVERLELLRPLVAAAGGMASQPPIPVRPRRRIWRRALRYGCIAVGAALGTAISVAVPAAGGLAGALVVAMAAEACHEATE